MRHRNALIALLLAQVVLITLTWWPGDPSASLPQPLFTLAPLSVEQIRIVTPPNEDGAEGNEVILSREGERWKLESAGGYPAQAEKVSGLLDSLVAIRVRDPVATKPSRHNQLHVGDQDHGKRISLKTTDDRIELVIGAAGNDRIHVRKADRDEVYAARGITEWSIRGDDKGYYDPEFVQFDITGLKSMEVENAHGVLHFERDEGGWQLLELPAESALDNDAVTAFIAGLNGLNIVEPVGAGVEPRHGFENGVEVRWTLDSGELSSGGSYQIGARHGEESFLTRADAGYVVKIANVRLDPIREARLSDFLAGDGLVQPE